MVAGTIPNLVRIGREDGKSRVFYQCEDRWSTQRGALDAWSKATITTHTANVELPKEQRAHLMWEVPVQLQVKLPGEQRAHLKVEVPFRMSLKGTLRHLTLEVQVPAKLRLTWESRPRQG